MANRAIIVERFPAAEPNTFTRINVIDNGDGTVSFFVQESDGRYPSNPAAILPTGDVLRILASSISGILPSANGGVVNISAADLGYFFGVSIYIPGVTAGAVVGANNQVRAAQFVLPMIATISKISIEVTTAVAASICDVGLYNSARNVLIQTTGLDTSTLGVKTFTLGVPVQFFPDVYYLAVTSNDATVQLRIIANVSNLYGAAGLLNIQAVKKYGSAANPAVVGILPASLGVITAQAGSPPVVLFER